MYVCQVISPWAVCIVHAHVCQTALECAGQDRALSVMAAERLSDVRQKPHSVERVTVCLCLTLSASASCRRLIRSLNILLQGKKCAHVLFERKKHSALSLVSIWFGH